MEKIERLAVNYGFFAKYDVRKRVSRLIANKRFENVQTFYVVLEDDDDFVSSRSRDPICFVEMPTKSNCELELEQVQCNTCPPEEDREEDLDEVRNRDHKRCDII